MKIKPAPAKRARRAAPVTEVVVLRKSPAPGKALEKSFTEVIGLIQQARQRAYQTINTALIDLYWQVGEYVSHRIESDGWGKSTISELAAFIRQTQVGAHGFSAQNLWRMRQFYQTYACQPKLSALLRELPWTHNLSILGRCKRPEEREFYLRLAAQEKWSSQELERQLRGALFERVVLSPPKVSPLATQLHPQAETIFKDIQAKLHEFYQLQLPHAAQ